MEAGACLDGDNSVMSRVKVAGDVDQQDESQHVVRHWPFVPSCTHAWHDKHMWCAVSEKPSRH